MQIIAQQLNEIRENVRKFEQKYGRQENSVKILAVSKTRSVEEIREAISQGQHDFGENYQQEVKTKLPALSGEDINWHFIGPLQSNKARIIAEKFSWIHSLDRLKIAQRLSALRPTHMAKLNVCIQMNISGESSKSGIGRSELLPLAENITKLPCLKLRGLMGFPAPTDDFSEQRHSFHCLREYFEELVSAGYDVDTLSMGTSNDMEAAIAEGASIVRIGTALFGPRR
jgi:pyridoxal phosphate enzyme (YggS family)